MYKNIPLDILHILLGIIIRSRTFILLWISLPKHPGRHPLTSTSRLDYLYKSRIYNTLNKKEKPVRNHCLKNYFYFEFLKITIT